MKWMWIYLMSLVAAVAAPIANYSAAAEQNKITPVGILVLVHGSDWNLPGEVLYKTWASEAFQKPLEGKVLMVAIDKKQTLTDADRTLAKSNESCPISYRTLPALGLIDGQGRVVAVRAGVAEINATGGLKATVQAMLKMASERDGIWKQAEAAQGVEKAMFLGKGLDRMGRGLGNKNEYQGIFDQIKQADPEDRSGYIAKYQFNSRSLLGQVMEKADKKQFAEAEAMLQKWANNNKLAPRQLQEVYGAWFALYQRWPEKKDSAKQILEKMKAIDPKSDLGMGAANR